VFISLVIAGHVILCRVRGVNTGHHVCREASTCLGGNSHSGGRQRGAESRYCAQASDDWSAVSARLICVLIFASMHLISRMLCPLHQRNKGLRHSSQSRFLLVIVWAPVDALSVPEASCSGSDCCCLFPPFCWWWGSSRPKKMLGYGQLSACGSPLSYGPTQPQFANIRLSERKGMKAEGNNKKRPIS
jgi:hypothetical protein